MKRFIQANTNRVGRVAVAMAATGRRNLVSRQSVQAMRNPLVSVVSIPVRSFASLPPHTVMNMPALSPTMSTGNIAKWCKQEGEALNPGDVIAEVETDKATVDFECQDNGYLAKILVPGGTADVAVGRTVAIVVDSKEAADAFKSITNEAILAAVGGGAASASSSAPSSTPAPPKPSVAPVTTPSTPVSTTPTVPAPSSSSSVSSSGRVIASPYAKKLAADSGIDVSAVAGTGPNGRIIAADVKEYKPPTISATAPAPSAAVATPSLTTAAATTVADARSGFKDIPHSNMRRVIAQRLTTSKQTVPHYYLTSDIQLDAVLALRSTLNAELPADSKISLNDFLIKASALACRKVPEVNSSWLDGSVRAYDYVDISVAVAIPDGLITPVIRDAHSKGLSAISGGVKGLVEKARAKKLAPEDYQGGTFTISNLGMFGVRQFAAIINPPQAAILAVGTADRRIIPDTTPGATSPYKQAVFMSATLSCDHRVVDGAVGAQWLSAFKGYLENPTTMLL